MEYHWRRSGILMRLSIQITGFCRYSIAASNNATQDSRLVTLDSDLQLLCFCLVNCWLPLQHSRSRCRDVRESSHYGMHACSPHLVKVSGQFQGLPHYIRGEELSVYTLIKITCTCRRKFFFYFFFKFAIFLLDVIRLDFRFRFFRFRFVLKGRAKNCVLF
jgi:hypothetical protein